MELLILLFILGVVLAATALNARDRQQAAEAPPKTCRPCELLHPPFAEYCRRCGRKL